MTTAERFLVYSRDHEKPVKILLAEGLRCQNIRVISLEDGQVTFLTGRRKTPVTVPLDAILSVSYARGDDGDTLKYAEGVQTEGKA